MKRFLPYIFALLFGIFTLCIMFSNGFLPKEDDAHAWVIAGNTTIVQLVDLMKVEGHFLIWYLILKPFASFNFAYPYMMYFINWIFMVLAVFILWKKSPFNNITKILITFSAPVLSLYSVQPRCYGIAILLLFLTMSFYKERLKKPYKYLVCLVLAANTCLPACITAGALGIMFIYDLITSKSERKIFYIIGGVVFLNLVLFYFQFFGFSMPEYESSEIIKAPYFVAAYLGLLPGIPFIYLWKIILLWIGTIVFPIVLFKSKKALFFFCYTEVLNLLFFTFVYEGRAHHIAMLFIIAIIAFWIYKSEVVENLKFDYKSLALILLCVYMVFMDMKYSPCELKKVIETVTEDKEVASSNIYTNIPPITLSPMLPMLNHNVFSMNGVDLTSYEGLKGYFKIDPIAIEPDTFASYLNPEENNYILLNGSFTASLIEGDKYMFNVELYKTIPVNKRFKVRIYKVLNLRKK